jgi:NNP family nitrate/nitrite transporter-like MFS transporter
MSDGARAVVALAASTVAFTVCFACWVLYAALVPLLVASGVYAFDETQLGWLLALPILTGALTRLPLGMLTDVYGGRVVFPAVMLAAAVPLALLSVADSYVGFLAAGLGLGLAGGSFAVGVAYVSGWFGSARQGTALGIFGMGSVGAALTTVGAPRLFAWLTEGGAALEGWRQVPRLYAAVLVVTAIAFVVVARDAGAPAVRRTLATQLAPLRSAVVWRLGCYYALVFGAFVALAQWVVPYAVNVYQMSVASAGLLAALFSFPAGVIRAAGGWLSDRYGPRTIMYAVFGGSVLISLLLSVPRMAVVSPGEGVLARQAGVVQDASAEAIVVDGTRYRLIPAPAPGREDGGGILPAMTRWHEPVVRPGDAVVKRQLLARGVTRFEYPAAVGLFAALLLVFGVTTGIGTAAVYKFIPEQFPGAVGAVGGAVALIGALGGFAYPIAFGYLLRGTGLWSSCWWLLAAVSVACLVWLHRVVRRIMQEEAPDLVRLIERRPALATRHPAPLADGGRALSVEALLKTIPFFGDLTDEQLRALAGLGRRLSAGAGEPVVRQGEPGDSLYVILAGSARVSGTDEGGQAVELAELGAGDFFGELALIDSEPRSATVTATAPSEFFVLERRQFLTFLSRSAGLLANFLVSMSTRIREMSDRFLHLMLKKERLRAEMEGERHRSLAQMVAGVAHEVNTPLGIVHHAASIITDRLTPDAIAALGRNDESRAALADVAEAAQLIQTSVGRADALIKAFRNLSVRQVTDTKETVDLRVLTREVVGLYRLKARQSRLTVEVVDRLGDGRAEWVGYPGYFSQILLNLIANADRYAYPEGQGGRVEVVLAADDGDGTPPRFLVTVRDFGAGIPREHLERVFDPFFTTGRDRGGTGLGLAIVHSLVTDALGGAIRIESASGEGTAVVMSLPAVVAEVAHGRD